MKKTTLILSILVIGALLAGCTAGDSSDQNSAINDNNWEINNSKVEDQKQTKVTGFIFEETEHDFGVIKQSGGKVTHDFKFRYEGKEPIKIISTPSSCMCTEAEINKKEFKPGEEGVLKVTFNPNLHAEPDGRFFKTSSIITEPKLEDMPEIKIWAEIDLDLGEEAFELKQPHKD